MHLLGDIDYYGISAVIAAATGFLAAIFTGIVAIRQTGIKKQLETGNGHTIGENSAAARHAAEKLGVLEPVPGDEQKTA